MSERLEFIKQKAVQIENTVSTTIYGGGLISEFNVNVIKYIEELEKELKKWKNTRAR